MDSLGAKCVVRCPDTSQVNATSSPESAVPEAFILHDGPLSVTLGPIGGGSGASASRATTNTAPNSPPTTPNPADSDLNLNPLPTAPFPRNPKSPPSTA